ncbi:MAG: SMC-Scp complex subunit ScpB [Tenericutes bacterium]|nr:MAG: SMC-Scp complex subunit ScpB [Mycoplasmatota bacterium]
MKNTRDLIYAVLFLKGKAGSTAIELSDTLKIDLKDVNDILEKMSSDEGAIVLKQSGDKFRLVVSADVSDLLNETVDKEMKVKLSKSVMETLTIIAYKQPTTKPDVERIRGVASEYAFHKLIEFGLIESNSKSDLPGQPNLFTTTQDFLELFDITNINDLPEFEQVQEITKEMTLFGMDE